VKFSPTERAALVAFLQTLGSEGGPPTRILPVATDVSEPAKRVRTVTQDDKKFFPAHVELRAGQGLWVLNNDTRTHNIRVFDDALDFDSGAQEPGETVEIEFPKEGTFLVFCGIHPRMELWVDVRP
jgi:cytochrome c peroxidase